jgi:hypothetical protein
MMKKKVRCKKSCQSSHWYNLNIIPVPPWGRFFKKNITQVFTNITILKITHSPIQLYNTNCYTLIPLIILSHTRPQKILKAGRFMKNSKKKKSSGKNITEIKAWAIPMTTPQERKNVFMDLAISSEFGMRNRGLVFYYGKDLIAYKRERPSDQNRNEFLRILSKFMTDCLEDDCPSSWKLCGSSFWEKFIYYFFPQNISISPTIKETDNFLLQLKIFVRWLDNRVGTQYYPIIETYTTEAAPYLKSCEHLLNFLFLKHFPKAYSDNWNPEQDIEQLTLSGTQYVNTIEGVFEVTSKIEDTFVLNDWGSHHTYYVKDLPSNCVELGMILSGVIGRRKGEKHWNWYITVAINPQQAKNYIPTFLTC